MKWFRFPRLLGLVVCVYLVGLVALFAMLSMQSFDFVRHAGRAQATVVALVAKAPVGSNRNPPASTRTVSLAPEVSYVVNGQTYTYTASHGQWHQRLKVGDQVQVQYNPNEPSHARLTGEGRVLVPGITVAFAVAAVGVAAILVRTRKVGLAGGKAPRRDAPALDKLDQPMAR